MDCDVELMIDRDVAEKEQQDSDVTHMTTGCHSTSDPVTTPSDHNYWQLALITPTSHNFQPYISSILAQRNVRFKIVASGCDQCVWPVCVVTRSDIE